MIRDIPQSLIEAATFIIESTLYESIILVENRIQFLKDRNQSIDTSHDPLAQHRNSSDIIDHFAQNADPTNNKSHTQWILGQYKKKNIRQEDAPRIHDALTNFDKYRYKLDKKDINQYKTLSDVESVIQPHLGKAATRKEESETSLANGRTLIHSEPSGLKVYRLEQNEYGKKASQDIYGGGHALGGVHTSWCTAARSNECMFDHYSKSEPLHVIHTSTGNVYQAHPSTNQLMDAKDRDVNDKTENADITDISNALDHIPNGLKLKLNKGFSLSKENIDMALNDNDVYVRRAAAKNPNATKEHLDKAVNDSFYSVREFAAKNPNATKENIDKALNDNDVYVRRAAASNINATKEHLDKALSDSNIDVRREALNHHNATKEHIDKALSDSDDSVRMAAAKTPNATKEHIDKALSDSNIDVRIAGAKHPNATKENIDKALNDNDVYVRMAASKHHNATKENIDKALTDSDAFVRMEAANHPNATKEHINKALMDIDGYVRRTAENNPNARKYGLII